MVGRDVEQHGHIGPEIKHIVELEAAQLHHIVVVVTLGHLQGQALAHIAGQPHVEAAPLQDVPGEHGGGGLAVAARDADHLGPGVTAGQLYFRNHRNLLLQDGLDHRRLLGDARALHYLVRIQDKRQRMLLLLPVNAIFVQQFTVFRLDGRRIAHKDIEAFDLGQHGGSCAALACPQYDNSTHIISVLRL